MYDARMIEYDNKTDEEVTCCLSALPCPVHSCSHQQKNLGVVYHGQVCPGLVILFRSLPRQSCLSSPTADWINREEKPCCTTRRGERERKKKKTHRLFQLCRAGFRHLRQHAGAQRSVFCFNALLTRQAKRKAGKYQRECKCMCSSDQN